MRLGSEVAKPREGDKTLLTPVVRLPWVMIADNRSSFHERTPVTRRQMTETVSWTLVVSRFGVLLVM